MASSSPPSVLDGYSKEIMIGQRKMNPFMEDRKIVRRKVSAIRDYPPGCGRFTPNLQQQSSTHDYSETCDDPSKLSVLEEEEEEEEEEEGIVGKREAHNLMEESHEEIVYRKRNYSGYGRLNPNGKQQSCDHNSSETCDDGSKLSGLEEEEGIVGKTEADNLMEESHEEIVYRTRKYSALPNQHIITEDSQDSESWSCVDTESSLLDDCDCDYDYDEEEVNEKWEEEDEEAIAREIKELEEEEEARMVTRKREGSSMEECGKRRKYFPVVRDYPPGVSPNQHSFANIQDYGLRGCDDDIESPVLDDIEEELEEEDQEALDREMNELLEEPKLVISKKEELLREESGDETVGIRRMCYAVRDYPPGRGPDHHRYASYYDTKSLDLDGCFCEHTYYDEEEMERLVEEEEWKKLEEEEEAAIAREMEEEEGEEEEEEEI